MGAITSKQAAEIWKSTKNEESASEANPENVTPRNLRTLPFDPRSPSGNVNRTPITIADSSDENGTPLVKSLKALPIDPRSPTLELTRTPLFVEEVADKKKYQPSKPSKLAEIPLTTDVVINDKDPRSPTEKVPRTPLEENADSKTPLCVNGSNQTHSFQNGKEISTDSKVNLNKKLFDSLEKDRRPLTDVQNKGSNQPKNQLQALQCRNVEEEFAKNEKLIMNKLENRNQSLQTSTDFIEDI